MVYKVSWNIFSISVVTSAMRCCLAYFVTLQYIIVFHQIVNQMDWISCNYVWIKWLLISMGKFIFNNFPFKDLYTLLEDSFPISLPTGSKKIEKDRNWRIGKDRTFLSLPTDHFASPKLYLFLSPHLSRVTVNIYLFLSLSLVISIFFYPLVYPPSEVVSIFFSIFRDWPLVYFSIPHLSPHSANFNLSLYPLVSILTTKWRVQF